MERVLKAKYLRNSSFLEVKNGNNASYTWTSILLGKGLLEKGIRWKIGCSEGVRIFRDSWLPRPSSFRPITIPHEDFSDITLSDLTMSTGWDGSKINDCLWPVDRSLVWSVPLSALLRPDILVWHYDSCGSHSVRSAYHVEMESRVLANGSKGLRNVTWWNKLWYAKVPNKVKIHMWRAFHGALPVRNHLVRRGIDIDPVCPCCSEVLENVSHSLWTCEGARMVWESTALWLVLACFPGGPFSDLCHFVSNRGCKDDLGVFCMVVWSL